MHVTLRHWHMTVLHGRWGSFAGGAIDWLCSLPFARTLQEPARRNLLYLWTARTAHHVASLTFGVLSRSWTEPGHQGGEAPGSKAGELARLVVLPCLAAHHATKGVEGLVL